MTQPQAEFLDLYRAGLKTAADLMKASLQNAEKLQNQQLVVIRTALDQQSKAISELCPGPQPRRAARPADPHGRRPVGARRGLLERALPDPDRAGADWMNEMNGRAGRAAPPRRPPGVARRSQQQHRKSA